MQYAIIHYHDYRKDMWFRVVSAFATLEAARDAFEQLPLDRHLRKDCPSSFGRGAADCTCTRRTSGGHCAEKLYRQNVTAHVIRGVTRGIANVPPSSSQLHVTF